MLNVQISPHQALQEISDYSRKLRHGLRNLLEVGDIPTGATPKEIMNVNDRYHKSVQ